MTVSAKLIQTCSARCQVLASFKLLKNQNLRSEPAIKAYVLASRYFPGKVALHCGVHHLSPARRAVHLEGCPDAVQQLLRTMGHKLESGIGVNRIVQPAGG